YRNHIHFYSTGLMKFSLEGSNREGCAHFCMLLKQVQDKQQMEQPPAKNHHSLISNACCTKIYVISGVSTQKSLTSIANYSIHKPNLYFFIYECLKNNYLTEIFLPKL
ncbi:hypothetical protein, partial [Clostridium sp. BL-8]|uniref:hypothetical protein n=1 Tax=Clostridium sp. BL-8 TaxID=349938 RepID=UPI001A9A66D6